MIAVLMLERFCLAVVSSNSVNFIHGQIRVVSAVKANQDGTENQNISEETAD